MVSICRGAVSKVCGESCAIRRYGGGACESVDEPYKERTQSVEDAEMREGCANASGRGEACRVVFAGGSVGMPVEVQMGAVFVEVGVLAGDFGMSGRKF